jgi:23S rRNA U2552 (ribose-2'-O)-methylase RlmE/FtsJ
MKHRSNAPSDPIVKACRSMRHIFKQHTVGVDAISAARAVYISPDVQRIDLTVVLEGGHTLILDLHTEQAGRIIKELSDAYEAIHPRLTTGFSAASWRGMSD